MAEPLLFPGLHPKASDALRRVPVPPGRIIQVIGDVADSAGTHLAEPGKDAPGRFWIINGRHYCAATDISIRNPSRLSEVDIINLLERLARNGFAAWYRKPGFDGWPRVSRRTGRPTSPHIHVVYAGIPMKAVLRDQIEQFLRGRNGLGNGPYDFHRFSAEAIATVKELFDGNDRGRLQTLAPLVAEEMAAMAFDSGFEAVPSYFSFELGADDAVADTVQEVEDLEASPDDFTCDCGSDEDNNASGSFYVGDTTEPGMSDGPDSATPNEGDDYEAALENRGSNGEDVSDGTESFDLQPLANRPWRVAKSLLKLRDQINQRAPQRSKASDGTIGDASHQTRDSDHNPWITDGNIGVVSAMDITHDPAHGCNADVIAASIIASRDTRVKYIIRDRHIISSQPVDGFAAWKWRPYNGRNPHTEHVHISVRSDKPHYDSTSPWNV